MMEGFRQMLEPILKVWIRVQGPRNLRDFTS